MSAGKQDNTRKDQNERKKGRRITMTILFAMNVAIIPLAITPLAEVAKWFVSDWPEIQLMFHGMFLAIWMGVNGLGCWAAWIGD